jgi:hypothetical protein
MQMVIQLRAMLIKAEAMSVLLCRRCVDIARPSVTLRG